MSAGQKRLLDQDPDYESVPLHAQQKRLKLQEQDAKKATIKTIEQIIKSQFSQEISTREGELDTINQRIYEAQVLLDSLRVSIITKYYATGGKSLTEQGPDGGPPSAEVHPTVKKYVGKRLPQGEERVYAVQKPAASAKVYHPPVPSQPEKPSVPETCRPSVVPEKPPAQGPRSKNKVRIVVGNVSKYIPSDKRDPHDHATHKWMVYVRCLDGGQDIAEVVRKVRFFLHPSYRPHDLVVLSQAPFHLVRKGWGEFPLRVQLHFCDRRNKPVDVIHNLKLDKTYTGLQTLGAETVVDLWMAQSHSREPAEERVHDPSVQPPRIKVEQDDDADDVQPQCPLPSAISDHVYSEPATAESGEKVALQDSVRKETFAEDSRTERVLETSSELRKVSNKIVASFPLSDSGAKCEDASQTTQAPPIPSTATEQSTTLSPKPLTSPAAGKSLLLQNSTSTVQPAANGLRTQSFVKCTDALGRVLLIPSTSVLRPRAVTSKPPDSAGTSARLPSVLKNSVTRPILPRNLAHGAPRMQVPHTSGPGPRYTLLVVPGGDKAHSQILLVPTTSLANKAVPSTSSVARDGAVGKSVASAQTQPPVQRKEDPAEILRKKVESVRLCEHKDYSDALFAVAALFPVCNVNPDEKTVCFPYASPNSAVYFGWPLPKRRAAEWMRASAIKKAMQALVERQRPDWCCARQMWSTKKTMLWCRRFGFTPLHADLQVTPGGSGRRPECTAPGGSHSSPKALLEVLEKEVQEQPPRSEAEADQEVDVEALDESAASSTRATAGVSPSKSSPKTQLPLSDCAQFVRETASEIGIHMSSVEVEPQVDAPVVEEMILAACRKFASTVLRHSLNAAHDRAGHNTVPDMVVVDDVYKALTSLSFCDFVTNSNLGIQVAEDSVNESSHL